MWMRPEGLPTDLVRCLSFLVRAVEEWVRRPRVAVWPAVDRDCSDVLGGIEPAGGQHTLEVPSHFAFVIGELHGEQLVAAGAGLLLWRGAGACHTSEAVQHDGIIRGPGESVTTHGYGKFYEHCFVPAPG